MEQISYTSKYNKKAFLLVASRVLERTAFYGFRSLIVLYMTSEAFDLGRSEALEIYGLFSIGLIFSHLIGAIIADFKIGNRQALIIGGGLQALGALSMCYQELAGLYLGLILFLLGEGFYTPNLQALYGKLFLKKKKLLDAAFSLLFLAVNVGAFFGPLTIAFIGEEIGFSYGFILVALISISSIVIVLVSRFDIRSRVNELQLATKSKTLVIISVFVLVGMFWGIYEIVYQGLYGLSTNFSGLSGLDIPRSLLLSLNSSFVLPISIVVIIIWSYYHYNQLIKLSIGFLLAAFSYGILLTLSADPGYSNLLIFSVSMFIMSLAEIHVSPVALSIATKYANPKYLAIVLSLAILPLRLFSYLAGFMVIDVDKNILMPFSYGAIIAGVLGICLVAGLIIMKKRKSLLLN